jgi:ATP-binding protein involved in chromosome partitioning
MKEKPIVEAKPDHEISKIYLDFANKIKSTYL